MNQAAIDAGKDSNLFDDWKCITDAPFEYQREIRHIQNFDEVD